jgi:hypothetical protein
LAFFLAVVEVVPEASSLLVVPPTVALASAAEPTLADGAAVWDGAACRGAAALTGCAGAVDESTVEAGFCAPIVALVWARAAGEKLE